MTVGRQQTQRQRTRERREERAGRILDVTKELILRWGYRKTTLDDIARHAEVGKGTLFLHWRNRGALFVSLLRRERMEMLTELREAIVPESDRLTLHGFVRLLVTVRTARPLLTAVLVGDQETLGRLAEHKRHSGDGTGLHQEFAGYLEQLRAQGLVRDDLSAVDLSYAFSAISYGFAALPGIAPEDMVLSAEHAAELCAETVSRTLAPQDPAAAIVPADLGKVTLEWLNRVLALAEQRYLASLEARPSSTDQE
jgi:AcrR family transcriptional regulator